MTDKVRDKMMRLIPRRTTDREVGGSWEMSSDPPYLNYPSLAKLMYRDKEGGVLEALPPMAPHKDRPA